MSNRDRFLIINENRFFVGICEGMIWKKYGGARIDYAANGREALEKIRSNEYSGIISEVDMPEMDGIEFYEHLKESFPLLAERMGFMSGSLNEFHTTFFEKEQRPWLTKPYTYERFLSFIDEIRARGAEGSAKTA